jgi:acylphosphatase
MAREATRLIIQGRVQGVGYRWWALARARELGLAGWVRNRADGSVEALAIGAPDAVAAFARACETGPRHALVETVTRAPAEDDGSAGFEQRETP